MAPGRRSTKKSSKGITRRDFVNAGLVGSGAALLGAPAPYSALASTETSRRFPSTPDLGHWWYGYGGVGDYAASHGNTPEVVSTAHAMRDDLYDCVQRSAYETGEVYDLIVVGAGFAGIGAAYEYSKLAGDRGKCLILENHPVFGGEAKQNEFMIAGQRLIAPQGSNGFSIPDFASAGADDFSSGDAYYYQELGIPTEFEYAKPEAGVADLRFGHDNYGYIFWTQDQVDVSYFFDEKSHGVPARHVLNPWQLGFRGSPYSKQQVDELFRWKATTEKSYQGKDFRRWLDSMTYKDFLEGELGLPAVILEQSDPVLASAVGLGSDVISAFAAFNVAMPGFNGYEKISIDHRHSFPGGNAGFLRHFVKRMKPEAIEGDASFSSILNNPIQFSELDRPGQATRIRQGATVVDVRHENKDADLSDHVTVTYVRNGVVSRVKARAVVMATGAWVNKHIVKGLPETYREAFETFHHAPILVANVALNNWRFVEKLGATGTLYNRGFGNFCNIRRPMHVGGFKPPLHPDHPAVLTFYVPYYYPGKALDEQCRLGRLEMLMTPFAEYERQIRAQLTRLYGDYGFNAEKDIEAIILNRWGHAYVTPQPGFYFGSGDTPAPRDVLRQNSGRIAFAHSELRGNQHWGPAAMEGRRAVLQLTDLLGANSP